MEELARVIQTVSHPEIRKIVLSRPVRKDDPCSKMVIQSLNGHYQVEKQIGPKVYHENLPESALPSFLTERLEVEFLQLNAWDNAFEYDLRLSRKGKLFFQKRPCAEPPKTKDTHNRIKRYLIPEGTVIPPLVDMGVFTSDGRVVKAMYDKYKQINRFLELIDDELKSYQPQRPLSVIDFGCGKSYLTFILYYYLTEIRGIQVQMTGLDLKADVIARCQEAAKKYGYDHLHFELGDIHGYQSSQPVDMVITLHACDTATDYALYNAIQWNARYIFSVPCCQHELNGQIRSDDLSILTRYGIIQERTAALMTDALRANLLTCCGYKTQVLEFVDLSHTPKNLLLRAVRSQIPKKHKETARQEVLALTQAFHLKPTLLHLLEDRLDPFSETDEKSGAS